MSRRRWRQTRAATIAALSGRRPASRRQKHAVPPACTIALATASPSASCMSASTRRAPSCAKRRALARPMPVLAPVTTAVFSLRSMRAVGTQPLACGAKPVDAELHRVAVYQVTWRALAQSDARGCASGDDVPGQERHELADGTDERWHVEDELAGRAALLGFALHLEPYPEVVHVPNLVRRGEKRSQRREAVAALALHPLATALQLKGPLGVIVVGQVAGDVLPRLVPLHVRGAAPDHDRQLHFPVHLGAILV